MNLSPSNIYTGMITTVFAGNQTITVDTRDQAASSADRDFTLLVWRPVIPLT